MRRRSAPDRAPERGEPPLDHPCLLPLSPLPPRSRLRTLDSPSLRDHQRLAALLQGVALLGHLEKAGLCLPAGWSSARLDGDGRLRVGLVEPGRDPRLPQERALDLLHRLFNRGRRRRVAGPGAARRVARTLQRRWGDGLLPLAADHLVGGLLEEAAVLWEPRHAVARLALAGSHPRAAAVPSAEAGRRSGDGEGGEDRHRDRGGQEGRGGRGGQEGREGKGGDGGRGGDRGTTGGAAPEVASDGGGPGADSAAQADREAGDLRGPADPWVVGPGPFRWRLLRAAGGEREALDALLAGDGAERFLVAAPAAPGEGSTAGGEGGSPPDPVALVAAGRWRAAVTAGRRRPPRDAPGRRALADAWLALGRTRRALAVLTGAEPAEGEDLVRIAACHLHLGSPRTARRTVTRAREAGDLPPPVRLDLAEVAARALANTGDAEGAWSEAARALEDTRRASGALRARAHLLAAQAAWDNGDREALERHLADAAPLEREAAADPVHAATLRQTRALAALAAGDSAAAAGELACALAGHRRRLPRLLAAALWNDLGLARARGGDLAGAEKALLRSLALYRGCDGSRRTTIGLANLAEVRLRRGRLRDVESILERTTAANRASGNRRLAVHDRLLWGRWELVQGRSAVALEVLRNGAEAAGSLGLEDEEAEARLLAARALGWLGRPEEAAEELEGAGADPRSHLDRLEPEERPALLALAGRRDDALAAAAAAGSGGPDGGSLPALWEPVLTGRPVPPAAWSALDPLGPYRAARAVFDLEVLRPGSVPARRLAAAAAVLRERGALRLAHRLEAREEGPWRALANHLAGEPRGAGGPPLSSPPGDPGTEPGGGPTAGWAALLADAGHPEARVWWESDVDARVLVDRPGGGRELSAPCDGGRLVLRSPRVDPPLEALFQLLRREAAGVARAAEAAARRERRPGGGESGAGGDPIVGESPALRRAIQRAERLAPGEVPILVLGESGTGKELVARRVHRASRRREAPLVAVNCAALSETLVLSELFGHVRGAFTGAERDRAGVFETAQGGTVFLDEIGDLPPPAQGMLLRVLQEGEVRRVGESLPRQVDVRVVAATHKDLAAAVESGDFRRDLYYRLKGAAVVLPPLRERGRDVLLLADHLLASAHRRAGGDGEPPALSEAARGRLLAHTWPGNVRELQNVLAVGVALAAADGGAVEPEHLELPGGGDGEGGGAGGETGDGGAGAGDGGAAAAGNGHGVGYHQQVEAFRRRLVEEALRREDGNQSAAARRLGLSRQALSYLVRSLEIRVRRR